MLWVFLLLSLVFCTEDPFDQFINIYSQNIDNGQNIATYVFLQSRTIVADNGTSSAYFDDGQLTLPIVSATSDDIAHFNEWFENHQEQYDSTLPYYDAYYAYINRLEYDDSIRSRLRDSFGINETSISNYAATFNTEIVYTKM